MLVAKHQRQLGGSKLGKRGRFKHGVKQPEAEAGGIKIRALMT